MHFTEYHLYCTRCDRPTKYRILGRSILITPCDCPQNTPMSSGVTKNDAVIDPKWRDTQKDN